MLSRLQLGCLDVKFKYQWKVVKTYTRKTVHVDEFEIGTPKKGKQGRSKTKSKIKIVLAVEIWGNKLGRA